MKKASAAMVWLAPIRAVITRSRARPRKRLTRVSPANTIEDRIRPPPVAGGGGEGVCAGAWEEEAFT